MSVLSAGAVEEGVRQLAAAYQRATGHAVALEFGTGPEIEKRLAGGATPDVLIGPTAVIERALKAGRISPGTEASIARVGVGVVVRAGAPKPDVATVDALTRALVAADSVVYNQASTGQYLESLFSRFGIAADLQRKTTRYGNAAQVLEHVIGGKGNEIGFGPITEIKTFEPKGVRLVAPLPAEIQNYTTYVAAVTTGASGPQARDFIRFLTTATARQTFAASGAQ